MVSVREENLLSVTAQSGSRKWDLTPPLGSPASQDLRTYFEPGAGARTVNVTVVDRAGNYARVTEALPPGNDVAGFIALRETGPYVKDTMTFELVPPGNYSEAYLTIPMGQGSQKVDLAPGTNEVDVPAVLRGEFEVHASILLPTEAWSNTTYRLITVGPDEEELEPVEEFEIVSSSKMPDYLEGFRAPSEPLSVVLKTSARLKNARLVLDDEALTADFVPLDEGRFQAGLLAPPEIGKHRLRIQATDIYGRSVTGRNQTFNVTEYGYPEVFLYNNGRALRTFPVFTRSAAGMILGFDSEKPITSDRISFGPQAGNLTGAPLCDDTDLRIYRYDLSSMDDGDYVIALQARSSYEPRNTFFMVLPMPPVLFFFDLHLTGAAFFLYHLFLVVVITASLGVLLFKDIRPTLKRLFKPETVRLGHSLHLPVMPGLGSRNHFILLAQLLAATVFASMATVLLTIILGGDFGSLEGSGGGSPDWWWLYGLANASFYEELVTRFLLIGVPLFIFEIISRLVFKTKVNRLHNCLLGGNLKIEAKDIFLILFAASLFGIAHLSGWSFWKILPTFLFGIAAGYLFYKVGLHAAILLHFATDYLGAADYVGMGGFVYLLLITIPLMLGLIAWGFIYSIRYSRDMFATLFGVRKRPSEALVFWGAALAMVLDVLIIIYLIKTGSFVLGVYLIFGLILLGGGFFFALIDKKWPALVLLLVGAVFSIPVAFVSVLACMAAYELYLRIRDEGPFWVLDTYEKPTAP